MVGKDPKGTRRRTTIRDLKPVTSANCLRVKFPRLGKHIPQLSASLKHITKKHYSKVVIKEPIRAINLMSVLTKNARKT